MAVICANELGMLAREGVTEIVQAVHDPYVHCMRRPDHMLGPLMQAVERVSSAATPVMTLHSRLGEAHASDRMAYAILLVQQQMLTVPHRLRELMGRKTPDQHLDVHLPSLLVTIADLVPWACLLLPQCAPRSVESGQFTQHDGCAYLWASQYLNSPNAAIPDGILLCMMPHHPQAGVQN